MSHYRSPQTPGIDGLAAQFTGAEATRLAQLGDIVGVQGDIIYHNGSAWVALGAGTAGQSLQTQGAGANPVWATGAGSGDMVLASIQTVTGAKTFNSGKLILAGATSGTTILNSGAIAGSSVLTLPIATDTLVGKATTDIFTNKTFDADGTGNSITNIENADIKAAAAIAVNKLAALTASQITGTDASGFLVSLAVATYPSLTELTYVKGVTSAIQTQIGTKAPSTSPTFATSITGSYLTASEILITDASKNIVSAPVATYPSLTELTYVKGVTSAIQTQINAKVTSGGALGTPSSGTGTNITGIPAANILAGSFGAGAYVISTSLQAATIELGHATDTTLSRVSAGLIAVEGVTVVDVSTAQTLTNKTLTSPVLTTPSAFTTGGTITLAENTSIALDPAGSADGKYSGITIAGTAGAALTFGQLCYLAVADSRWELADADAAATMGTPLLGMCVLAAGADGNATTMLLYGTIRADAQFPALTIGATVYGGETAGAIQVAIPTGADNVIRVVGHALTADEIMFNPSQDHQITVA